MRSSAVPRKTLDDVIYPRPADRIHMMRPPIEGGTILITGASSGIGRDLARQFASRAGVLILVARRKDRLERLKEELLARHPALGVHLLPCDLSDDESVGNALLRLASAFPAVDILINNAGLGDKNLFDRAGAERMEEILRVNVSAVVRFTHHCVPHMVAQRRGGIMNVGSGAGFIPMPGSAAYVGSKHFINGFSQNLSVDLSGTGVVVTQVCPGPVETEFNKVAGFERYSSAGWIGISSEQCAREAIRGFERGRFLVFPGKRFRLFMFAQSLLPASLKRRVLQRHSLKMRNGSLP
jgi:hypothetical protein